MTVSADAALLRLKGMASELGVARISECVLSLPAFSSWTGSGRPEQHHYGTGGLIRHTLEVCDLLRQNGLFFGLSEQQHRDLFLAGLFHDVGKLWDYGPVGGASDDAWAKTSHATDIHHISRSAIVWSQAYNENAFELPASSHDAVLHAILSHHGLREWGSPVSPQTKLAWLLHLCDSLSARMDDCSRDR